MFQPRKYWNDFPAVIYEKHVYLLIIVHNAQLIDYSMYYNPAQVGVHVCRPNRPQKKPDLKATLLIPLVLKKCI